MRDNGLALSTTADPLCTVNLVHEERYEAPNVNLVRIRKSGEKINNFMFFCIIEEYLCIYRIPSDYVNY
jgi:hypothetical protein